MERNIGTIIAFLVLILITWKGYKKYKNPVLWLIFLPVFSILHTILGWHVLALAFQYDTNPDQFPLYATIVAPSYFAVGLFGLPLEFVGLPDEIAYSIAFGLNGILVGVLIIFGVQWFKKRVLSNNA